MKTRMAIIIAHAMTMTAAPTGLGSRYDGNTVPQGHGTRENIITESTLQEFRNFPGENGKNVRGRILAYNPNTETVTIATENGKTVKTDLSIFSKANQAYVREWDLIKAFFTQNRFCISVRKKKSETGAELLIWRPEEEIVYGILLENRSDYDLKGLTVDYCIYFEPDRLDYREQVESPCVKCGTLKIGTLAAGEKTQVETQSVNFPKEGGFEYYKDNTVPAGETLGIWIRIYLPLKSGNNAMREYAKPTDLMNDREWATSDIQASKMGQ